MDDTASSGNSTDSYPFDIARALRQLAITASHSSGFGAITVNLHQKNGTYKVVADTADELLDTETTSEFWAALLRDDFKIANSYLIPPGHSREVFRQFADTASVMPQMPPVTGSDDWDPDHMLIVPLISPRGGTIGYLSADYPPGGKLPTPELISDLETFAQHAVFTVELQAETEALRQSEERFRSLVQYASDVTEIIAPDATLLYVSPSISRVLGYKPHERVGKNIFESTLISPHDLPRVRNLFMELARNPGAGAIVELQLQHKDGSWRDFEVSGRNLLNDPNINGIVVNYHDVTERKALEKQLQHHAFHDPLTGLPNRALFTDRLQQALRRIHDKISIAVLLLDLDRFKVVNDSLGHDAGDQLLIAVTKRLQKCLRPEDTLARLGGDEFGVLLERITEAKDAARVAERIADCLEPPLKVGGHRVFVTTSIGVVVSSVDKPQSPDILRDADAAMYRAKNTGGARYAMFDVEMNTLTLERLQAEDDLRQALQTDELVLHYQPEVELATGRVWGVEALLRWLHPKRGLLTPAEFIPLAEETGLILPLGRWAMGHACLQVREWHKYSPLTVSVNLSAKELRLKLVDEVAQILVETGIEPEQLELEITESALIGDIESIVLILQALRDLGVRLAIDDFGTGYSSLSYLKRLPVNTIKIDKSFVSGLGKDSRDEAVVRAIVTLATTLHMHTVAEGVQTAEQRKLLLALGCESGQGYYFSKPLSARAAESLIAYGQ